MASEIEGLFDRDGRMHVVLDGHLFAEADLSAFEIEMEEGAP